MSTPSLPSRLLGAVRPFSRSSCRLNASQPAPPSPSNNPHAARVTAASAPSSSSPGDARSRLAKLQAQRLEELNRGKSSSGPTGRGSKPEQKWSNRTLIALATSVGACTYLMGTYHGYNAGKSHAVEEAQLAGSSGPQVEGDMGLRGKDSGKGLVASRAQVNNTGSLSTALAQLLPLGLVKNPLQCEPENPTTQGKCRLAELTQYHCDLRTNGVVCQPIDRIFRICKGRPAVEVSHIVEFDDSGKPYLPAHLSEAMPPSSHWHELRSPDL